MSVFFTFSPTYKTSLALLIVTNFGGNQSFCTEERLMGGSVCNSADCTEQKDTEMWCSARFGVVKLFREFIIPMDHVLAKS